MSEDPGRHEDAAEQENELRDQERRVREQDPAERNPETDGSDGDPSATPPAPPGWVE